MDNLLSREMELVPKNDFVAKLQATGIFQDRVACVSWLHQTHSRMGFQVQTFALSVNYLDRYLDAARFDKVWKEWMFRLLSVACLSLAAKIEEVDVPSLLDMQLAHLRHFQQKINPVFDPATVQRMELNVLSTLGWRLHAPTPFAFAEEAFNSILLHLPLKPLLPRVSQLLMDILTSDEEELVGLRPSLVASIAFIWAVEEISPLQTESIQSLLLKAMQIDEVHFRDFLQVAEECIDARSPKHFDMSNSMELPHSPSSVLSSMITQSPLPNSPLDGQLVANSHSSNNNTNTTTSTTTTTTNGGTFDFSFLMCNEESVENPKKRKRECCLVVAHH